MRHPTKIIICLMLLIGFCILTSPSAGEESASAETVLNHLIDQSLANSPLLEAAVQRALASDRIIEQAGILPDPQLTLGLMNLPVNSFSFSQEPMTGKLISVMQMFPFPGKLRLAVNMAQQEAAAVRYQELEVKNQIVQSVKRIFYDIYAIDRALETVDRNRALMEQIVQIAESRYETGSGLQQDVLRAQVELSRLEDDQSMWMQKRKAAEAGLNAVLDRPMTERLATIPAELNVRMDVLDDVHDDPEETRPLLLAWKERIGGAGTAIKLAHREFWPNFSVGVSYNQRDNLQSGMIMHDFFSTQVSFSLPVFTRKKVRAKVAEKELMFSAAEADYRNIHANVLAEIESIKAEVERNRKRALLYKEGILIQAQQSLDSAFSGYQVGKVDFLTLLNNWMMLQNYELQYYNSLANYCKGLAGYELATGRSLDGSHGDKKH